MDDARFDDVARGLIRSDSRRGLARQVIAVALVSVDAIRFHDAAEAGRKRRERRRRCRKKKNRTWCGNKCVRGTCCPGKPCGEQCQCLTTITGGGFCVDTSIGVMTPGCSSMASCNPGWGCVRGALSHQCQPGCPE
jgi:hypothetical protein